MREPRFVAESQESLIAQAQAADPPVQDRERAELVLPSRRVTLEARVDESMIVWTEVVFEVIA